MPNPDSVRGTSRPRPAFRAFAWLTIGVACALAVLAVAVRFWLLPNIDDHRAAIARELGAALHQRVAIGQIALTWAGMQPHLILNDVQLLDTDGGVTLGIGQIENSLPWRSLLRGRWQFDSFRIKQLEVVVRRDSAGEIFVAGYPASGNVADDSISAWLRKQPRIAIDDAVIIWQDELRGAAPLRISRVSGLLENDGGQHRFALRASPPADIATPLDIRGEVWEEPSSRAPASAESADSSAGRSQRWRSRVYMRSDQVDSAALRPWFALPDSLIAGSAAVSAWLSIGNAAIENALVDASAKNLVVRLAPDLQKMEFPKADVRMVWDAESETLDLAANQAQLKTVSGELVEGSLSISQRGPLGISQSGSLKISQGYGEPNGAQPVSARGSLRVDQLSLAAIAEITRQLPVAPELRQRWRESSPAGMLKPLTLEWSGALAQPADYRGEAEVSGLAIHPAGAAPRFSGLSGHLAFSETGGAFALDASAAEIALPEIFADSLRFHRLAGQVEWHSKDGSEDLLTIEFKELAFANDHLAGDISGRYQATAGGRGIADVSAHLSRADLRFAERYTPLVFGDETRAWLANALRAGQIGQASLRVQGYLDNFPFADGKAGVFEAKATVTGGVVDYAESWPRAERVSADVLFHGARMEVSIRDAVVAGLRMDAAQAVVPVIGNGDEVLQLQGKAAASGAQFLRALALSPLAGFLKDRADNLAVDGNGKLALELSIPLRRRTAAKISGDYAFIDNSISVDAEFPPLENASGKLAFSNGKLSANKIRGSIKGSPVTLDLTAAAGNPATLTIQGRSTVAGLQQIAGIEHPWLDSVHGETDWRAQFRLQADAVKWTVESDLAGIASALPAPLDKTAETRTPIRIDGVSDGVRSQDPDRFTVSYGDVIRANLALAKNGNSTGNGTAGRRLSGEILLGTSPAPAAAQAPPDAGGISLSSRLAKLDFDAWRDHFSEIAGEADGPPSMQAGVRVDRIALHVDEATAFNRRFTDLQLNARAVDSGWSARLDAAEVAGDVVWEVGSQRQPGKTGQPSSAGKLTARLQRLDLPPAIDHAVHAEPAEEAVSAAALRAETDFTHAPVSLPAIDLQIEKLSANRIALGRFTLLGRPQGSDWRIERLTLDADDAKLEASGVWQTGQEPQVTPQVNPVTRLNVEFDVADIGAFFKRIELPDGMKEGRASLAGALSWPGSPLDLRYANLSGNLVLRAHDGRFARIEPGLAIGLGKLLSVLSLQNLPRRMALDFDDVVEKGYSFDEIAANVDIQRGVANSDEFVISSPTARTVLSGEVDLAAETQNLYVKVTPSFSDSLSLATVLLGGPVIGLTSYVVQKMLKDPIGKLTAHRYQVTGTWIEPTLSPLNETPGPE